ncbi:energy-coupling factor transporter transmembrane protein EcfT [Bacillus ectoiniformans]|nr:energy-coupling factor transporter transmembrane protein EcfT [Bacillus ectoiniformans]
MTCFYFFILTTPVMHVTALLIRCRVPTIVVELFILIYRFIFLFLEYAEQIRTAQMARFGYQSYQSSFHSLALLMTGIVKQIFIRNTHLTEAMKARSIDCFVLPASFLDEPKERHLFLSIGLAFYVIAATNIFLQELMK